MNEEDVHPESLPDGVIDFVEDCRMVIANQTGTDEEKIRFNGITLHFVDGDGDPVKFEVMAVR